MLATFTETSKLLEVNRSTLYNLKAQNLLNKYLYVVEGVNYLELDQVGKQQKLSSYLNTIIEWKGKQPCKDFDAKQWLYEQGENLIGASIKRYIRKFKLKCLFFELGKVHFLGKYPLNFLERKTLISFSYLLHINILYWGL